MSSSKPSLYSCIFSEHFSWKTRAKKCNHQLCSEAARPSLQGALTARLWNLFNISTIPLSVLHLSGLGQLLGNTEELHVCLHYFFVVSPMYIDHRMWEILTPFRLLPRKYNFPLITLIVWEGCLHLTCIHPLDSLFQPCCPPLYCVPDVFWWPGFVKSVLLSLFLYNQLWKKLMSPSVSC